MPDSTHSGVTGAVLEQLKIESMVKGVTMRQIWKELQQWCILLNKKLEDGQPDKKNFSGINMLDFWIEYQVSWQAFCNWNIPSIHTGVMLQKISLCYH